MEYQSEAVQVERESQVESKFHEIESNIARLETKLNLVLSEPMPSGTKNAVSLSNNRLMQNLNTVCDALADLGDRINL